MIVELADNISSDDQNFEISTYQSTLFPAPATKAENYQFLQKRDSRAVTHVSHGAKEEN